MIRLLTSMASATAAFSKGDVVELDAEVERRLIKSGQAEAVRPEVKRPTALKPAKKRVM